MAEMIPDRLPRGASVGEKKVFALLQQLPDDVIVYYEPIVAERYPDFVVILPTLGLLIVEVKGWYPNQILEASNLDVAINSRGRREISKHPIRQAREYKFQLMDVARLHPETQALLRQEGAHAGKFIFPFGHMAILSNCSRQQLDERRLSEVFPTARVFARDELETLSCGNPVDRLNGCFDPWWAFGRLSDRQISILRSIIHPEIVLSPPHQGQRGQRREQLPLKVLDVRQERNAHALGEGHRIIYGVAGSGKTVILIARARLVAQVPDKHVLILCYNRALARYFHGLFAQAANVTCLNFHQWASQRNFVDFVQDEDEEVFGERLLARLQDGEGEAYRYDAVFIDEAQDFSKNWFLCAKLALKEPDDGDLLIVGDGSQLLYRRRKFTWKEAGVNAVGRTINTRFDLDKNYRNTREIMRLAAEFVSAGAEPTDPESGLQIVRPNPDSSLRSGPVPEMLVANTLEQEFQSGIKKIVSWLASGLKPSEIAVLYRANKNGWVGRFVSLMSQHTTVYWPHNGNEALCHPSGVCVTTMHSAKGLQWRAVLVMRSDMMPYLPDRNADRGEQERLERGLMYVAMTRAEEMLAFTRSTRNGFAGQIQHQLDAYASNEKAPPRRGP